MFPYANARRKTPHKIHVIYLDNKKIYYIFQTWCINSVIFSTVCCLFLNFIFFCSNNTFFSSTMRWNWNIHSCRVKVNYQTHPKHKTEFLPPEPTHSVSQIKINGKITVSIKTEVDSQTTRQHLCTVQIYFNLSLKQYTCEQLTHLPFTQLVIKEKFSCQLQCSVHC